jgi:hypothetical protein
MADDLANLDRRIVDAMAALCRARSESPSARRDGTRGWLSAGSMICSTSDIGAR